eukprot:CAMPEP_0113689054 /NCGR_PEP_ID=MMETSP0038_2-20120614/16918_1 /TAXON_ID=2898 /ORGANISM="Cryptomonas paramecium" /LENGTH=195 /DNA_ID=CAMNT_0000610017 /DNA_START=29 /DNA_END=612 /DNA_ORIENTATION=+ /assembly_acc=CAM_ASM_000170
MHEQSAFDQLELDPFEHIRGRLIPHEIARSESDPGCTNSKLCGTTKHAAPKRIDQLKPLPRIPEGSGSPRLSLSSTTHSGSGSKTNSPPHSPIRMHLTAHSVSEANTAGKCTHQSGPLPAARMHQSIVSSSETFSPAARRAAFIAASRAYTYFPPEPEKAKNNDRRTSSHDTHPMVWTPLRQTALYLSSLAPRAT